MLSFAGDMPGLAGVGEGSGINSVASASEEVRADPGNRVTGLAIANVLSEIPTTHASAQVRTATDL
jgi:hypothetical protein